MNIDFSLSESSPKAIGERLRGYKWLLLGQLTIMFIFLVVYQLLTEYPFPNWQEIVVSITGLVMLVMNYLTYELIKDLTNNKFIQYFILILLWFAVIVGIITGLNIVDKTSILYFIMSLSKMVCSFVAFSVLLFYMVYDIFNEKHDVSYRLWGSAVIYVLIGATFGMFYEHQKGLLGFL